MTTEIYGIDPPRLRNDENYQFGGDVKQITLKYDPLALKIKQQWDVLNSTLT